jgi:hypothetical protein
LKIGSQREIHGQTSEKKARRRLWKTLHVMAWQISAAAAAANKNVLIKFDREQTISRFVYLN